MTKQALLQYVDRNIPFILYYLFISNSLDKIIFIKSNSKTKTPKFKLN
jgi:hypothetical protein